MTEIWKLPKAVRTSIEQKRAQLKRDIIELDKTIDYHGTILRTYLVRKAEKEKELKDIETKYRP
jgi:hypothetical protein